MLNSVSFKNEKVNGVDLKKKKKKKKKKKSRVSQDLWFVNDITSVKILFSYWPDL